MAAALAAAAASAAVTAAAASTAAAVLMRVPCDPAHTAKHDGPDDDRRQIEIRSQKLHHKNALLSARFEKFLLDLGNVDLDFVVVHILVGTEHHILLFLSVTVLCEYRVGADAGYFLSSSRKCLSLSTSFNPGFVSKRLFRSKPANCGWRNSFSVGGLYGLMPPLSRKGFFPL